MQNRLATNSGYSLGRVSIIALTLVSFVFAITIDTWHTHHKPVSTEWNKHHSESQSEDSTKHSDDNCPLCYHHLTKDILLEHTTVIINKEDYSDYPFYLFSVEYTDPDHTLSVRGPPALS